MARPMSTSASAIALAVVASVAAAAELPDVAALAEGLFAAGAPAAGVGFADSDIARCAVAGRRDIGEDRPVAEGDLWHIGSITKSMTATLAARLVVQGAIGWESTVGDVLGERIEDIDPGIARATLLDLHSHRAGLPANIGTLRTYEFGFRQARAAPAAERLRYAGIVLDDPPATPPPAPPSPTPMQATWWLARCWRRPAAPAGKS